MIDGPGGPLPIRVYRPGPSDGRAAIVFLHGGGFVFGSLETHDAMCRSLALATGTPVAAVDYRLAPEHPYPAALQDSHAALAWVRTTLRPNRMALAGDSAGAQLAVATALAASAGRAGGGDGADALGLLYPVVDPDRASASQRAFGEGHMLTGAFLEWSWSAYRGGGGPAQDALFDLRRADLSGLPPTILVTAGFDPLRDEGLALGARLVEAGVPMLARHYPDMLHGFAGLPGGSLRTGEALTFLADGLRASLRLG